MKTALISLSVLTLCFVNSFSQAVGDFRSVATGNWNVVTTWERYNGVAWITPAPSTPVQGDGFVTIQAGHTVTVPAAVTMDQVTINGTLQNNAGIVITIGNSGLPAGSSEFIINGTFIENGVASTVFNAGATWNMGPTGTIIKTGSTASNNWQGAYEGGIATIPATSNWILRHIGGSAPVLTTIGGFYGNLTLERIPAGTWATVGGSTFNGAAGFPTVKGTLDVGGTGAGIVNFQNLQTNAQPTLILGNLIVRGGSTLMNYGTGIEVRGNLTVTGAITYDNNDARRVVISGGNAQTLAATGVFQIYDFTMNKTANSLTLNNTITVDNVATFTNGIINSSAANLFILNANSTLAGPPSNTSFVNGPVRRLGNTGLTFPVGKVNSYRPIILGNSVSGNTFWTETFGTAPNCAATRNQLVSAFAGANGAWTETVTSGGSNRFFVSATEAGMGSGGCGNGCLSNGALLNQTLHLGNVANSNCACLACPAGDCGAAYDACGSNFCGTGVGAVVTNRRAQSPTVNCTGRSNIVVSFIYMENGQGLFDNGSLYYFDGAVWSFLADMPKTLAGGCGAQGLWTPFAATLPASANNNPNVRIGFLWVDNADDAGSDPSFAIDDVMFSEPQSIFTAEYFPTNPQVPYGNVLVPSLNSLSNCEYWILNRNAGTDARTVGLTWNAASCFNTAFASFEVARWDNVSGVWQDHNGTVVGGAPGGTVTTPLTVANFSPFAIAYVPLPLPVEMESITADCEEGTVVLKWQTASEINNDHFTIERSPDAIVWEEIGRVEGNGSTNTQHSYAWVDMDPIGNGYYRIKQADFDGQYKIFDPLSLNCSSTQNWINVYPNPSAGTINIELSSGSHLEAIMVYSSLGQFTTNLKIGDVLGKSTLPIDISFLEPGTYYLRLLVNGHWITKPVVIIK